MSALNSFPNLKRVHCTSMKASRHLSLPPIVLNHTIEFIENDELYIDFEQKPEIAWKRVQQCLPSFQGLKKFIVRKPFVELTGSDLQNPDFTPEFLSTEISEPVLKKLKKSK